MIRRRALLALLILGACSKADPPPVSKSPDSAGVAANTSSGTGTCPATGQWAQCSLLYRLERAGLAPQIDSGAKPAEKALSGKALVLKIGRLGVLELFLYSDSAARIADGKKLDRSRLVNATAQQTMQRERTLIESSNVIGLLTSLSAHQRERVSDAITAGPPQPSKP